MNELIMTWLAEQGVNKNYLEMSAMVLGLTFIIFTATISYYIAKTQVINVVHKLIVKTKNTWDDALIEHNVLTRFTLLLPFILILFLTPLVFPSELIIADLLVLFAKVFLTFQIARSISAVLNVSKCLYGETAKQKYLPLNAIIQVIKLVIYLVAVIVIIALILDRSPVYLLSGLGALTAVLILVFQDTIKGLVASIQISANKMVVAGDWIELPKYGADGDVIEIGLNTVKVQNFDKTITTVPTYALISDSFKNWRNMYHTGARRIKRTLIIDISSIDFYSLEKIDFLASTSLLKSYLTDKKQRLEDENKALDQDGRLNDIDSRQLTNIGTFRAYIEMYLHQNTNIRNDLTCMVRQLPATESGLPLELYCFANSTDWKVYEGIQADVFDHLFAIAPHFDLRIFQNPTGHDWKNALNNNA
ncbi:mechanosensitive ion channel family protein [Colwellia sp. 4_MG-2023]|jgi:miniconductance mechanosensitive channel|uniref:mechanosensitive ion channel family protein n=1 Tax=unclassified Colwellia TaxID=196834 RepID=UPI001C09CBB8|nr:MULTISPECIES: mechanosensitive ion channel family protein [unclassified Colwellia]MBU2923769.1 mechanosensitive ion channel family protein [Colwellia sp. C2M11]MDO6505709.1 mechanosensitive ion channel family protein [Colwellia sp. 5_MG-2023]MDO6554390.1 mechanosensitive ion channel family protein [Colwellia sp. 4_MG-2023]MDO6652132.1 mechanosensitive ion channel family protein [Colwellia sp. 3_MG-2023]MDO6664699.1 mechanosensitive ion channel family protein [Colwellia sp. 2_MG-2023]